MKKMRGFAMPTAIFLLVILSLLGAFMVSLSTTENITSVQDVLGIRAHLAARAGLEKALFSLRSTPTSCPVALNSSFTLEEFTVKLECSVSSHDEGDATPANLTYLFYVSSSASTGGSYGNVGYVERQTSAFIEF